MAGNLRVCALKHMKNSMYKRKNGGKYMEKKKTDTEIEFADRKTGTIPSPDIAVTDDANEYFQGYVYSLSSAVTPVSGGFSYYFLDIRGGDEIHIHFGYDRYFTAGGKSRLFINRMNSDGEWEEEHFAVPAVRKNGRLEFDLPEYLKSLGVKYKLYKRYDFYNGCDTNYSMIWSRNFQIRTGKSLYYDFIVVEFNNPVLKLGGKTVRFIQESNIKSTNEAVDFLLLHINDKAEMSMKEFGELLDGIKYVNKESGEFEISFTDGTRLGGFGNSNKIDWNE